MFLLDCGLGYKPKKKNTNLVYHILAFARDPHMNTLIIKEKKYVGNKLHWTSHKGINVYIVIYSS